MLSGAVPYRQCGAESGRWVIYFHGAPGGPSEIDAFGAYAERNGLRWACFERFVVAPELEAPAYFQHLATAIAELTDGAAVDLVGFSIGAFVALQVYPLLRQPVRGIHLLSAAAPLVNDDLWRTAAGRTVFRLAQTRQTLFRRLCEAQGWAARHWPQIVLNVLFAGAAAADRAMLADAKFRKLMIDALRTSLGAYPQGYARDILLYVRPWQTPPSAIDSPSGLWHGIQDNEAASHGRLFTSATAQCLPLPDTGESGALLVLPAKRRYAVSDCDKRLNGRS